MKGLHFDCFSGVSGDMAVAALIDAGTDVDAILSGLASLHLPLEVEVRKVNKAGFAATSFKVACETAQPHRHLHDIRELLKGGRLTERQRDLAGRIFQRLAEAEATVHGSTVEKVHFHEVGALDSIADIVSVAIGIDALGVDYVTSRPVPTGSGTVKCAHGVLPVPAPGTAELLKGMPLSPSPIQAELTTPTGAAILATLVNEWLDGPRLTIERIGYGAGTRDLAEQPNLLRIFVGEVRSADEADQVWLLETNLDNVSAETIGYCYDRLLAAGALDVYSVPILMKKNRPAITLSVLTATEKVSAIEDIIFSETGTLGIRKQLLARRKLPREPHIVQTSLGPISGKIAWLDGRLATFNPEYEDCARLARERHLPLSEVYEVARRAYKEGNARPDR
jgi:pyridinium-3,5-bisthiocarboxylic acid mononucleotide nickel chelatase